MYTGIRNSLIVRNIVVDCQSDGCSSRRREDHDHKAARARQRDVNSFVRRVKQVMGARIASELGSIPGSNAIPVLGCHRSNRACFSSSMACLPVRCLGMRTRASASRLRPGTCGLLPSSVPRRYRHTQGPRDTRAVAAWLLFLRTLQRTTGVP